MDLGQRCRDRPRGLTRGVDAERDLDHGTHAHDVATGKIASSPLPRGVGLWAQANELLGRSPPGCCSRKAAR